MNATQRLFVASCLSIMVTSMIFSIRADILQPVAADYGLNNALIGLTMSILAIMLLRHGLGGF